MDNILNSAIEKGAIQTLIEILKKENLSDEQAYLLLSLACMELTKDSI